jgi:hypothetical protein
MVQKLFGAVGIVGVLVVAGMALTTSGVNPVAGSAAINGGIFIGMSVCVFSAFF